MSINTRIAELEKTLKALTQDAMQSGDDGVRRQLHGVVQEHAAILESPLQVSMRMMMEPHMNACLRVAQALKIVEILAEDLKPRTAAGLAGLTKADRLLIVRIMRPLCRIKIFDEVAYETYAATPTAKFLSLPEVGGGQKFMFDEGAIAAVNLPSFLASTGYKNPEGPMGNFQSAFHTELQMFPWIMAHPEHMNNFNLLMAAQRHSRSEWFDVAPAEKVLFDGYSESRENDTLLVDIGGNTGNDLQAFRKRYSQVKGRLINQDLPQVIESQKNWGDVVPMKHDFFTSQPVNDARAYYFRYIMHDYSDAKCREILQNVVKAMKPGYSKLLVFDYILPDVGTPMWPALLDIQMMASLSGMERTESQWKELLSSVGLEVVKFWKISDEREGLIEAVQKM